MDASKRPKVLYLSWYSPNQADAGERVRFAAMARQLSEEFDVTIATLANESERIGSESTLIPPSDAVAPYIVRSTDYLRAGLRRKAIEDHILGRRKKLRRYVDEILERVAPDIVVANQPFAFALVPESYHDRLVLDTHNVNSSRLRRVLQDFHPCDPRRILLRDQVALTEGFERHYASVARSVWVVSNEDLVSMQGSVGAASRVRVIPNGADFVESPAPRRAPSSRPVGLFFGSLGYSANIDGLLNLRDWILAIDKSDRDKINVEIAGSGPHEPVAKIFADLPQVRVIGRVENPPTTFAEHDFLVVPLRQGGGTRLKVLEAAACRLPILSTGIGAEGSGLAAGSEFLQVEDGPGFLRALDLMRDRALVEGLSRRAFEVAKRYDWNEVGKLARRDLWELLSV